jgi:hypothetical protein
MNFQTEPKLELILKVQYRTELEQLFKISSVQFIRALVEMNYNN